MKTIKAQLKLDIASNSSILSGDHVSSLHLASTRCRLPSRTNRTLSAWYACQTQQVQFVGQCCPCLLRPPLRLKDILFVSLVFSNAIGTPHTPHASLVVVEGDGGW